MKLSPSLQAILGNTAWLMGDRLLRMGLGVIVVVWVARYLGPDRFGVLNFAVSFVALFTTFSTLGLENVVVSEIVHDGAAASEILFCLILLAALTQYFVSRGGRKA